MNYIQIPELPSYSLNSLQDESLFEVCYWNGSEFISQKISGAVIKAAIGGGAVWGQITGSLINQSDLVSALNAKFNVPTGNFNQYINGQGTLVDFPDIPDAQVNSNWTATTGVTAILNKPSTFPAGGPASGDLAGAYPSPTIKESVNLTGTPTATTPFIGVEGNEIITAGWFLQVIQNYVPTEIPNLSPTEQRRGVVMTNNSTSVTNYNTVVASNSGSVFAIDTPPTAIVNSPRVKFYTTAAAANSRVAYYISAGTTFMNRRSGFRFQAMFCPSDQSTGGNEWYVPLARQFVGLCSVTTIYPISSTVSNQSQLNIFGVGSDEGDINLHLFHNDDTGNAQKLDLGSDFPANKTSAVNFPNFYYVQFYAYPNSNEVAYNVKNLFNGAVASGVIGNNLPLLTSPLIPQIVRTSGNTAQNVSMDIGLLLLSSLY